MDLYNCREKGKQEKLEKLRHDLCSLNVEDKFVPDCS